MVEVHSLDKHEKKEVCVLCEDQAEMGNTILCPVATYASPKGSIQPATDRETGLWLIGKQGGST